MHRFFKKSHEKEPKISEKETLTPEESIVELKSRFYTEIKDDSFDVDEKDVEELKDSDYRRFLISKNYDVDLALNILLESLVWRKQRRVRYITVDEVREELLKDKIFIFGYDLQKRLVAGVYIRNHFPNDTKKNMMEKLLLLFAERAKYLLNPENEKCTLIFDLTDFSLSNMDYDIIKFMIKVFTEFFPETLGIMLVVNAPWIFKSCWKMVKPLLDPITAKKIAFVSSEKLFNYVDPEVLPPNLGGTNENIVNYGLGIDIQPQALIDAGSESETSSIQY